MATFVKSLLSKRHLGRNLILLLVGVAIYIALEMVLGKYSKGLGIILRVNAAFIVLMVVLTCNSGMLSFLDISMAKGGSHKVPLHGLIQGMQILLFFIGGIIIIAVLLNKSPKSLIAGLGASAAVLMLIFKDSILGFVAGVQLSQNNMIRLGDWIQMPDGSANGTVEEITLNTVKVRNWDNTLTMIPPYTLVSTPFKNWRGMAESDGRRVDKRIFLDLCSLEFCTEDMIADIRKNVPLMADYTIGHEGSHMEYSMPTNSQLYRIYIERYLRRHPIVAQNLDLIIAQREPTQFGVPIEVYFFLSDKVWAEYESIQSDIFDHLLAMAPAFGLRLYQLPLQN